MSEWIDDLFAALTTRRQTPLAPAPAAASDEWAAQLPLRYAWALERAYVSPSSVIATWAEHEYGEGFALEAWYVKIVGGDVICIMTAHDQSEGLFVLADSVTRVPAAEAGPTPATAGSVESEACIRFSRLLEACRAAPHEVRRILSAAQLIADGGMRGEWTVEVRFDNKGTRPRLLAAQFIGHQIESVIVDRVELDPAFAVNPVQVNADFFARRVGEWPTICMTLSSLPAAIERAERTADGIILTDGQTAVVATIYWDSIGETWVVVPRWETAGPLEAGGPLA